MKISVNSGAFKWHFDYDSKTSELTLIDAYCRRINKTFSAMAMIQGLPAQYNSARVLAYGKTEKNEA